MLTKTTSNGRQYQVQSWEEYFNSHKNLLWEYESFYDGFRLYSKEDIKKDYYRYLKEEELYHFRRQAEANEKAEKARKEAEEQAKRETWHKNWVKKKTKEVETIWNNYILQNPKDFYSDEEIIDVLGSDCEYIGVPFDIF